MIRRSALASVLLSLGLLVLSVSLIVLDVLARDHATPDVRFDAAHGLAVMLSDDADLTGMERVGAPTVTYEPSSLGSWRVTVSLPLTALSDSEAEPSGDLVVVVPDSASDLRAIGEVTYEMRGIGEDVKVELVPDRAPVRRQRVGSSWVRAAVSINGPTAELAVGGSSIGGRVYLFGVSFLLPDPVFDRDGWNGGRFRLPYIPELGVGRSAIGDGWGGVTRFSNVPDSTIDTPILINLSRRQSALASDLVPEPSATSADYDRWIIDASDVFVVEGVVSGRGWRSAALTAARGWIWLIVGALASTAIALWLASLDSERRSHASDWRNEGGYL